MILDLFFLSIGTMFFFILAAGNYAAVKWYKADAAEAQAVGAYRRAEKYLRRAGQARAAGDMALFYGVMIFAGFGMATIMQ